MPRTRRYSSIVPVSCLALAGVVGCGTDMAPGEEPLTVAAPELTSEQACGPEHGGPGPGGHGHGRPACPRGMEPDQCDIDCATVALTATRTYPQRGPAAVADSCVCAMAFSIPSVLIASEGSAGRGTAFLSYWPASDAGAGPHGAVRCTYYGDAQWADEQPGHGHHGGGHHGGGHHGHGGHALEPSQQYVLAHCTVAGVLEEQVATYFKLEVVSGDASYGPTTVTVAIAESNCCTPTTCAAAGAECGTIADGCGGQLNCGECPADATCGDDNICRPIEGTKFRMPLRHMLIR